MGCLPDCAIVLALEAGNDDLNNYTILTRGVPKRTGETRLWRRFDDPVYEKRTWVHRSLLGTWEGTFTVTLFGKGSKLVLLTSWVSLLNNLTLSVGWRTLHSE